MTKWRKTVTLWGCAVEMWWCRVKWYALKLRYGLPTWLARERKHKAQDRYIWASNDSNYRLANATEGEYISILQAHSDRWHRVERQLYAANERMVRCLLA